MFKKVSVQPIFPTPLWLADLDEGLARRLNADLKAAILALIEPRPSIPRGTNWQTDPVLHKLPQFAEFFSIATKAAFGALDFMKVRKAEIEITGAWANVNPPGGVNSAHTHPNNYLSGVYYVDIPDGAGQIYFSDPRPQAQVILPPTVTQTPFNANEVTVEVMPGRLLLFPGWLTHAVPVNRSEGERISIAFNVMFRAFGESMAAPLWLGHGVKVRGAG